MKYSEKMIDYEFFSQWSFWHELNVELAEMIILLIEDENDNQALHSKLLRLS